MPVLARRLHDAGCRTRVELPQQEIKHIITNGIEHGRSGIRDEKVAVRHSKCEKEEREVA